MIQFIKSTIDKFLQLKDTPNSYTGDGGKIVKVNSAENGLEFADEITYTAGTNVSINGSNQISATDTTYTGSTSITLSGTSFRRAALTGDVTASVNSNELTIADDAVTEVKIKDSAVTIPKIKADGTASSSTYLRGDGIWASIPVGQVLGAGTAIKIDGSNKINVLYDDSTIKVNGSGRLYVNGLLTDTTYSAGTNMSLSGTTFSATDTTYTAGTNVSISSSNVISATNTTYSAGTLAVLNTGTSTANRVWSAKILSDWLSGKGLQDIESVLNTGSASNTEHTTQFRAMTTSGTIWGGRNHILEVGARSGIYGGNTNRISGTDSFIGGGSGNEISITTAERAAIVGGTLNNVRGNDSIILGGYRHTVTTETSSIVGGESNTVSANTGGIYNSRKSTVSAPFGSILGGNENKITRSAADDDGSAIIGGYNNVIGGVFGSIPKHATIVGGDNNTINAQLGVILGGWNNTINHDYCVILSAGGITTTQSHTTYGINMRLTGTLNASTKNFDIKHPFLEKTRLIHSSIEGPQISNMYRGKVTLKNGSAIVNIDVSSGMTPGTFSSFNRDWQVFLQNETGWDAVKMHGEIIDGIFEIACENSNNSSDTINWMVMSERYDTDVLNSNTTDENGKLIVEKQVEIEY